MHKEPEQENLTQLFLMAEKRIKNKELWKQIKKIKKKKVWIKAAEELGLQVTQPAGGSSHSHSVFQGTKSGI